MTSTIDPHAFDELKTLSDPESISKWIGDNEGLFRENFYRCGGSGNMQIKYPRLTLRDQTDENLYGTLEFFTPHMAFIGIAFRNSGILSQTLETFEKALGVSGSGYWMTYGVVMKKKDWPRLSVWAALSLG